MMPIFKRIAFYFQSLFGRKTMEEDLEDEISLHLEELATDFERDGMSPQEARKAALNNFGLVESIKDECRDSWGMRIVLEIWRSLKGSFRTIHKYKGYSFAVIVTFAVCIGLNTAMFGVLNSLFLNPQFYDDGDRIVRIGDLFERYGSQGKVGGTSVAYYLERKEQLQSVEAIGLNGNGYASFREPRSNTEHLRYVIFTASFFDVLKVSPMLGRAFREFETEKNKGRVVILLYEFWQKRYNGDREILGKTVFVNTVPHEIIGVMPKGFQIPPSAREGPTDGYQFITLFPFFQWSLDPHRRSHVGVSCFARLKPGVTHAQLQSELEVIAENNGKLYPEQYQWEKDHNHRIVVSSLRNDLIRDVKPQLLMMQASLLIVFIIACANIASLVLTHNSRRFQEFAIRAAVGADPKTLVLKILTETMVFAFIGGAIGIVLALVGLFLLQNIGIFEIFLVAPRVELDLRMLFVVICLSFFAALISGVISLLPIMLKLNLSDVLRGGERTGSGGRFEKFYRGALVFSQMAFAVMVLAGGAVLLKSFVEILHIDTGFETESIAAGAVALAREDYDNEQARRFLTTFDEKLKALPGVKSVGFSNIPAYILRLEWSHYFIKEEEGSNPDNTLFCSVDLVTSGYFETLGISLLQGRLFNRVDYETGAPVVVIDRQIADKYYPNENPVGKRVAVLFRMEGNHVLDPMYYNQVMKTIIGVVESTRKHNIYNSVPEGMVYEHMYHVRPILYGFVIKTAMDPYKVFQSVRDVIWGIDSRLTLMYPSTLQDNISKQYSRRQKFLVLVLGVGAIALGLCVLGINGVIASSIASRTKEIGIRTALGASRSDLLGHAMRYWVFAGLAGIVSGLLMSSFLTPLMQETLYATSPHDPLAYGLTAFFTVSLVLISAYISSVKNIRIDPIQALRGD